MSIVLDEREKIELPYKRLNLILNSLFLLLLFYNFPLKLYNHIVKSNWLWASLYFIFLLIGVLAIFNNIKKILLKIAISVDDKGITVENKDYIPWEDIQEIEIRKRRFESALLIIFVSNPDTYIDGKVGTQQRIMRISQEKEGTPFSIPLYMVKYNREDFLASVKRFIPSMNQKHS
jgi:hypothetical protein